MAAVILESNGEISVISSAQFGSGSAITGMGAADE